MSNSERADAIRILFFGMPGAFSRRLLLALDRPDVEVVGVVHLAALTGGAAVRRINPQPGRALPLHANRMDVLEGAPRYLVGDLGAHETTATLAETYPDLIVVACFPARIPAALRQIAGVCAINVHPSLLPRHRGPDPIFWVFRHGERSTGVTLHVLDDGFDTGPILAQAPLEVGNGATVASLDAALADAGARILTRLLDRLPNLGSPTAQDESRAGYESHPTPADLVISPTWSVDRARWFIQGVGESHGPLMFQDGAGEPVRFRRLATENDGVPLRLSDGVIRVSNALTNVFHAHSML